MNRLDETSESAMDATEAQNFHVECKILQLPTELLLLILEDLGVEDLVPLIFSCRRLHILALPVYITRQELPDIDLSSGIFAFYDNNFRVLPVLRMSLFITSLKDLSCQFSDFEDKSNMRYKPYEPIRDVIDLRRFVWKLSHIDRATLDIGKLTYWHPKGDNAAQLRELFDTVARVSNTFSINSNSCPLVRSANRYRSFPPEAPAEHLDTQLLPPFRSKLQHWVAKVCGKKDQPEPYPLERFVIGTHIILQNRILFGWTVETINASRLVSLAIHITNASQDILDTLLPLLVIPTLQSLSIRCNSTFRDVARFISRHQNVSTLTIGEEVALPDPKWRPPSSFLSHLTTFHARPEFLLYLLTPANSLPCLNTLTVRSYVPIGPHLELTGIDNFLSPIAHRLKKLAVSLNLRVVPDHIDPAFHSLLAHRLAGKQTTRWLHLVTSLTLEQAAPLPGVFLGDALYFFPDWLADFPPRLEHLSLAGDWFASSERVARVSVVRLVNASRPGMRTVTLDGQERSIADWLSTSYQ